MDRHRRRCWNLEPRNLAAGARLKPPRSICPTPETMITEGVERHLDGLSCPSQQVGQSTDGSIFIGSLHSLLRLELTLCTAVVVTGQAWPVPMNERS